MNHTTHYCRSHRFLDCDISDLRGDREREASENTVTGHAAHEPDEFAFAESETEESNSKARDIRKFIGTLLRLTLKGRPEGLTSRICAVVAMFERLSSAEAARLGSVSPDAVEKARIGICLSLKSQSVK